MVILYPSVIQPLFNKLSPLPDGELRNRIENLAAKLKFPLKHLYEIDGSKRSSHSNAYFFGLPWVTRPLNAAMCHISWSFAEKAYCHL
jgi:STE24 endopeptidase